MSFEKCWLTIYPLPYFLFAFSPVIFFSSDLILSIGFFIPTSFTAPFVLSFLLHMRVIPVPCQTLILFGVYSLFFFSFYECIARTFGTLAQYRLNQNAYNKHERNGAFNTMFDLIYVIITYVDEWSEKSEFVTRKMNHEEKRPKITMNDVFNFDLRKVIIFVLHWVAVTQVMKTK